MTRPQGTPGAEAAIRYVLAAGFLAVLALSLPGHMTYDSLAQLREGRLGIHETWGPMVYAAILGFFDHLSPGPNLYVVASGLILFGALARMTRLRPSASWWGVAAAALLVLAPQLLIYQGVVWKDVLFANLSVAAFVLLAGVTRDWPVAPRPWLTLGLIVLALAVAAQVRQNGVISAVFAALILAWSVRRDSPWAALRWGGGGFLAVLATAFIIGWLSTPPGPQGKAPTQVGVRILQHYDLVGAAAHDPHLRFDRIADLSPSTDAALRTRLVKFYSPERVDYLGAPGADLRQVWQLSDKVIGLQWRETILRHPGPYLRHRLSVFRWVLLTPAIDSCVPYATGVVGSDALADQLGLAKGQDATDRSLNNYASWLLDTPVFSHLTYVLIALIVAGILLVRGQPQDLAVVGLLGSALAFTASFLVISIACDYRYLYFMDLAALAGLFYLAIDPPVAELRQRFGR